MRVLQINLVCHIGSTGKICDQIAQYLIEQGHEVLNCSVEGEFKYSYEYKYETKVEELCKRICFKIWGRKQWQTIIQTFRLIKKIRRFHPDIVHIHNIHHNVVNIQLLFNALANLQIPIVYTMHDMWGMTGGCFHDFILDCSKKSNSCKNCNMLFGDYADCDAKLAEHFLTKKKCLYKKQKRICFVTVSEWLKKETDNSIISEFQREVIRNGIDISSYRKCNDVERKLKALCKNKKIVLSCASYWMERKGLYDFIALAKILGEEYQIVLIGNCDEEIRRKTTNIIFMDNIKEEKQLAQLYSQADIYVSLSKCETFGLTLVEATCCGTPILGYDNSGMSEVLSIAGGIRVENGDIKQVAEKIKEVCSFSKKRKDEEIERIRQKFSALEMCKAYAKLYESML